jgi:beta-barrel assembly-enhancing protease
MLRPRILSGGILLIACLALPGYAWDLDQFTQQLKDASKDLGLDLDKIELMGGEVSTEQEVEIGANLAAGLLGAAALVDDKELQRYVNDVGFWVAAQSQRADLPWRFGVIDSPGINAFAAPGGYVVLTLGLYQLLENEAQLAGVLAHEISHVVGKHHLRALQESMQTEFWTDLTVYAARDKVGGSTERKVMQKLVDSGLQLYTTGLDRRYEFDADLRGVVLMARAGYDPYAFLDVLTTIDSINPESAELTVFMNTHPPTGERLDTLATKMDGKLDSYAAGVDNAGRFRQVAAKR